MAQADVGSRFANRAKGRHIHSSREGDRAAFMYSLIVTAKMNDVDPHAWLADVLARIATHPAHRIDELLPWHWKTSCKVALTAAAA